MATPTCVQHVLYGANSNNEATGGNGYKLTLPNATLTNNAQVLFLYYPSGATLSSIVGNVNTWSTTPAVTITDTNNSIITAVFLLLGGTSGDTAITVTFTAVTYGFRAAWSEWYNVATSSATDGSQSVFNVTTNPQASGTVTTTTNGDLILHFGHDTGNGQQMEAGTTDNLTRITRDPACTLLQADPIHGFFCEYRIQDVAGAVNPGVTLTSTSNGGWSNLTLALKAASAGTAPANAMRIFGVSHIRPLGTGLSGNRDYPYQFPTQGNLHAILLSDPKTSIALAGVSDPEGAWSVYAPDPACPTSAYKTSAHPSPDGMLTLTINDAAAHDYTQGIAWDIVHGGSFDTASFGTSGTTFGPGNTPSVLSITPGASAGVTLACMELNTGPPDSLVTPAGFFAPTFYTNETDLSVMDNGDCHGGFAYSSNAAQSWVWHNTASSAGCNGIVLSFTAAPIITVSPQNQRAAPGQSVTFSVTATASAGSVTYQWYRNGTLITGATSATYTFNANYPADYGATWYCALTDSNGSVNTLPAQIIFTVEGAHRMAPNMLDIGDQDFPSELNVKFWF